MYAVGWDPSMQSTYYYRGMNLIGYTSAEETAYYRMNAHGNVVAVVDGFGETLKTYKYEVFGKQEEDGNEWLWRVLGVYEEDTNPFRYCAEYYDEETEFIYLRARYYSPEIQRFISEDPIKDGINWYAYCGNNPVNCSDPLGLIALESIMQNILNSLFSNSESKPKSEPDWADKITNGNATYDDYQSAAAIDVNEWKEFSQFKVVKAHDIATNILSSELYNYEATNIDKLTINEGAFSYDIDNFKKIYEENRDTYERIAKATGIPPQLIAAIHYRESGCNFNTYLHNGDPLGQPTVNYPQGIYFDNFEDAAIDALSGQSQNRDAFNLSASSTDIVAMCAFAERYNGLGYYNKGVVTPYVYSGTNIYEGGKYVRDGVFDPNVIDKQPGIYILISSIM